METVIPGTLSAALTALGMYPGGHPNVVQTINAAYVRLVKEAQQSPLVIAVTEGVLVIGEQPLYEENAAAARLRVALTERGWEHVAFNPGLSRDEVEQFLSALAGPAEGWRDPDRLRAWIGEHDIVNIVFAHLKKEALAPVSGRERARKVYQSAKNVVKNVMEEARLGRIPDASAVFNAVHELTEVILTDPDAMLGLTMLKSFDEYTFTHSVNVGALSIALAKELGFGEPHLTDIGLAGLMHDVGKTRIPIDILNKPAKLSDAEWKVMREHPVYSHDIVRSMERISPYAVQSVRQHHVKFDRTGYPSLAEGEEFIAGGMIVAIADCYDSMTTQRQYQKCFDPKESLEIMVTRLAGNSLNPKYLQAFIRLLGIYPIGSAVRLDTGEVALVTGRRSNTPLKPVVKLLQDSGGHPYPDDRYLDLSDQSGEIEERHIVAEIDNGRWPLDLVRHLG